MSLHEKLNKYPLITAVVTLALTAAALCAAYRFTPRGAVVVGGSALYTTDNGQTWFTASSADYPPFMHNGQMAVRAYLYAGTNGREFVGYLERYTDQAKALFDQAAADKASGKAPDLAALRAAEARGRQIKKPTDNDWTPSTDIGKVQQIMKVVCPDASPAFPKG